MKANRAYPAPCGRQATGVVLGCSLLLVTSPSGFSGSELTGTPEGAGDPPVEFSGGWTTVFDRSRQAYSFPVANLPASRRASFFVGNSFFNENWVAAPASTAGRDGLGPLFNARSCSACHFKDGRGRAPEAGEEPSSMILRISVPGGEHGGAPKPDPHYGNQIQHRAIPGVPAEATVRVEYEMIAGKYADGDEYELRRPIHRLTKFGYGEPVAGLMISGRVAPALMGAGLLEAIPRETLTALEDVEDRDGDGISGRMNSVWDEESRALVPGRFGWKAEQPTVRQQVAAAFRGDMGLTTPVFRLENHTPLQTACVDQPSGGDPEVSPRIFDDVVSYCRALAVPARRDWNDAIVLRGERLFREARCHACHVPELRTGVEPDRPELSDQLIRPYTDLLLHDMGEGLSDGRPSFGASGQEWRTPPLWGVGLIATVNGHTNLLHDGRARGFAEAILWHGGEAEASRNAFRRMNREDREALLAFLESL